MKKIVQKAKSAKGPIHKEVSTKTTPLLNSEFTNSEKSDLPKFPNFMSCGGFELMVDNFSIDNYSENIC